MKNLSDLCRNDIKRILAEEPKERWTDFEDFKSDLLKGFPSNEKKLKKVYTKTLEEFKPRFN